MVGSLIERLSRMRRSPEQLRDQIEELTVANREQPDPDTERQLVRLRNEAFSKPPAPTTAPAMQTGRAPEAPFELVDGVPEIAASALTGPAISAGLRSSGCLLVRGLMQPAKADELARGIDRALEHRDLFAGGGEPSTWFEPFEPAPRYSTEGADWNRIKAGSGAVWACDSPRMMFELLEAFEAAGILSVASDYLGERPSFSMNKSVLRRTPPDTLGAWHQDGAFLGEGIKTLNFWLALSDCGERAPSLDLVPQRFEEVLETGTEGAAFPWSVSNDLAAKLLGGEVPPRPVFEPGDALLFDHLCLHRTGTAAGMDEIRYATETWCFASSAFPDKLVPLVV